jgi:PPM family protein phosphatase
MRIGHGYGSPFKNGFLNCSMMNPESIYYLFEVGNKDKQEDYIWPIAGKATLNDRVFIVCDGSGSFYNGGIASKLICQFMGAKVFKIDEQKMSGGLIDKLLTEARDRLISHAREYRLDTDLATTFSMLILYDQKLFMSWYGDSRIYHLRGGEILFRTEGNLPVHEPIQLEERSADDSHLRSGDTAITRGIKADDSPIYAETKWIEDVRDGDHFLLCSKGLVENATEDCIELLVRQNDKTDIDLAGSFRRLAVEKALDNYSMYLIKVNVSTEKGGIRSRIDTIRRHTSGIMRPIYILALVIIGLISMVFYFQKAGPSEPAPEYQKDTSKVQPVDVLRRDTVPSALLVLPHREPIPAVTDSVKTNGKKPKPTPQNNDSADIQTVAEPEQTNKTPRQTDPTPISQKEPVGQMLIKFTTDESCKLEIRNMDLDNVIDWDLSGNDNGTIYLKPGKYTIVATSVISSSKTKTYNFDVIPGGRNTTQNIHIRF